MYFEWKDSYGVDVEEIDRQHRKLFEIGGRISDLVLAKDGYDHYDEIMTILDELKNYTIYHFNYEEKLMEEYGFPGLDEHKIEHMFLIKKLERMKDKDIDANQEDALINLVTFVSDWISGHILKTDMGYKDFFKEKGVR